MTLKKFKETYFPNSQVVQVSDTGKIVRHVEGKSAIHWVDNLSAVEHGWIILANTGSLVYVCSVKQLKDAAKIANTLLNVVEKIK